MAFRLVLQKKKRILHLGLHKSKAECVALLLLLGVMNRPEESTLWQTGKKGNIFTCSILKKGMINGNQAHVDPAAKALIKKAERATIQARLGSLSKATQTLTSTTPWVHRHPVQACTYVQCVQCTGLYKSGIVHMYTVHIVHCTYVLYTVQYVHCTGLYNVHYVQCTIFTSNVFSFTQAA